ncbi:tetratricopeptide repeat protein [Borrelia persica]|uniref:tetratricopeptide repeat protein n=1 Tax=Borrelia persica TaxID=44448 RepID=UPI0004670A7A|nr:tetratricopeptide repeat protein [Borrelia persica]
MLDNKLLGDFEDISQNSDKELLDVTEKSKRGYQLIKEERLFEAESLFDDILQKDNDNNYALVGLGDIERKKRNFDKAIIYYQRCLSKHSNNNYALFGLGDCYRSLGDYKKATEIWEEYLKYDPENITVLTRVASSYRKLKNFQKSRQSYLRVLELVPDNDYALVGIGHLYYDFKEYKEALKYWLKMYEINQVKIDVRVLTSIGNCYRKLKEFGKGIYFFKRALDTSPNNFYAIFGLADCYRGSKEYAEALKYWLTIIDKDPKNNLVLTRVGDTYRYLKDYENAQIYYKKALDVDFDMFAILGLALLQKEQGQYEEALTAIKNLIKTNPKNSILYVNAAECYEALGQVEDAIDILSSFLQLGMKNVTIIDYITNLKKKMDA